MDEITLVDLCRPVERDYIKVSISWGTEVRFDGNQLNLPVIQVLENEPQTAVSLSFELISVVYLVHQLDNCPHFTIPTNK